MVEWFEPRQLLRTAWEALISATLGRHADRRSIEAANKLPRFFDFSGELSVAPLDKYPLDCEEYPLAQLVSPEDKDIWIDYVSDLGDGFHSTYAVAYLLAQEHLNVEGTEESLRRGHILIFGGDEVYPTADRREYKRRLEQPYIWAWEAQEKPQPTPFLFALPGNHDWYDSLSSFLEFFGDYEKQSFANGYWRVPQNRSYFALKLPKQWWVLGIDFQLQSDLDYWQIKYFEKVVQYMQPGDRIILCCAEPFWVYEEMGLRQVEKNSNLKRLLELLEVPKQYVKDVEKEDRKPDKRIVALLAGDLHHYFRVFYPNGEEVGKKDKMSQKEAEAKPREGVLKITSGGGGAFLHPTHGGLARAFAGRETHCYPSRWRSRCIGLLNLLFPFYNFSFCLMIGVLYAVLGSAFLLAQRTAPLIDHANGMAQWGSKIILTIGQQLHWSVITLLLVLGFYFLTSPSRWRTRCVNHWKDKAAIYQNPSVRVLYVLIALGGFAYLLSESQTAELTAKGVLGWLCRLLVITSSSPLLLLLVVLTLGGFYFITFSEPMTRGFGWAAGGMHGLCHLVAAFSLAHIFEPFSLQSIAHWETSRRAFFPLIALQSLPTSFSRVLLLSLLGSLIGPLLVGIYLGLSLNACGQHSTAAFSSLKIQRWKNFLRLKINLQTGDLTIYPIGINQVPRHWESQAKIQPQAKIRAEMTAKETAALTPEELNEQEIKIHDESKSQPFLPEIPKKSTPGSSLNLDNTDLNKRHYKPQHSDDLQCELIEGPILLALNKDKKNGSVFVTLQPTKATDGGSPTVKEGVGS